MVGASLWNKRTSHPTKILHDPSSSHAYYSYNQPYQPVWPVYSFLKKECMKHGGMFPRQTFAIVRLVVVNFPAMNITYVLVAHFVSEFAFADPPLLFERT